MSTDISNSIGHGAAKYAVYLYKERKREKLPLRMVGKSVVHEYSNIEKCNNGAYTHFNHY